MRTFSIAALLSVAASATLLAQSPSRLGGPGAEFLLSRTAQLELTDAQVTRLAAVARRTEARRKTMRGAMDSARARFQVPPTPADSAARRQFRDRMRADMERMRDQMRTDRRDAIAVLTPDQQARAWEMVSSRGRGMSAQRGMGAQRGMMPRQMVRREMMRRGDRPDGLRPFPERGFAPRMRERP